MAIGIKKRRVTYKSMKKIAEFFKNSKAAVAIAIVLCVVIVLVSALTVFAAGYNRILPGLSVGGVQVGGLSEEDAQKEISRALGDRPEERYIAVACGDKVEQVSFDELEMQVDSRLSAKKAFAVGREKGAFGKLFKMISLGIAKEDISPEVTYNKDKMDDIFINLAVGQELEPQNTYYTVEGEKLIIHKGHGGKLVNREKTVENIIRAFADPDSHRVEMAVEVKKETPVDFNKFYEEITAPKRDATFEMKDNQVVVVPEKIGVTVDKQAVRQALNSGQERCEIPVKVDMPQVLAADLEGLLFRDTLGTFSSNFATSSQGRASNVILTANRVNGVVLMPGDVFSYDKTVGRRTAENGYKVAGVYIGNKVENGMGGGICQTSSTLYSAVLYANLEIVERTSHSLPVSYMPPGQDATIAEGYIDFKFRNNTNYPIKVVATAENRKVVCTILGTREEDIKVEISNTVVSVMKPQVERTSNAEIPVGYKRILNKGADGYVVESKRIVSKDGQVIKTEKLTKSVYRAAPIEEEVNPESIDTPSEELAVYTPGMTLPEDVPKEPEEGQGENAENTEETVETDTTVPEEETEETPSDVTVVEMEEEL